MPGSSANVAGSTADFQNSGLEFNPQAGFASGSFGGFDQSLFLDSNGNQFQSPFNINQRRDNLFNRFGSPEGVPGFGGGGRGDRFSGSGKDPVGVAEGFFNPGAFGFDPSELFSARDKLYGDIDAARLDPGALFARSGIEDALGAAQTAGHGNIADASRIGQTQANQNLLGSLATGRGLDSLLDQRAAIGLQSGRAAGSQGNALDASIAGAESDARTKFNQQEEAINASLDQLKFSLGSQFDNTAASLSAQNLLGQLGANANFALGAGGLELGTLNNQTGLGQFDASSMDDIFNRVNSFLASIGVNVASLGAGVSETIPLGNVGEDFTNTVQGDQDHDAVANG